jgi:single-strand DNA-binding protein
MNKVILSGRLTKDCELTYIAVSGTPKATFTLAVERSYQKDKHNKKVDFINCELLGKGAENLASYLTKGKALMVDGELNIDNYEKDGEKRSFTKVKVDRVEFQQGAKVEEHKENNVSEFQTMSDIDTDDIPF